MLVAAECAEDTRAVGAAKVDVLLPVFVSTPLPALPVPLPALSPIGGGGSANDDEEDGMDVENAGAGLLIAAGEGTVWAWPFDTTGEIAPGDGVIVVVVLFAAGRQVVSTSQEEQSKLMAYPLEPVAWPWNLPEVSMVTPVRDIQPRIESQAKPPSVPLPLLVTPPCAGERLIQPSFVLQA